MNTVPQAKLSNASRDDFLSQEVEKLKEKIEPVTLPPELKDNLRLMIRRVSNLYGTTTYAQEYEKTANYIGWIVSLPWDTRSDDNLDIDKARKVLDKHHYGMEQVKERILEYLAVINLQTKKRTEFAKNEPDSSQKEDGEQSQYLKRKGHFKNNVLCLIGLPGIGKTTVAKSIAESLNRKFVRIPFGGMASSVLLRGQSKVFPDAEPGLIIKHLRRAGTKNPLILLDEIDRIAEVSRAEVMGVLLELLDPEQNSEFRDHFIDYPFDLSEVMFITTGNNTGGIANAVLDRLEVVQMPSYSDQEKMVIARDYLFPQEMENVGLSKSDLQIENDVWQDIIRPLGFDAGVRTLSRTIQGICRIVAKRIVLGEGTEFRLTSENVKHFLPKW